MRHIWTLVSSAKDPLKNQHVWHHLRSQNTSKNSGSICAICGTLGVPKTILKRPLTSIPRFQVFGGGVQSEPLNKTLHLQPTEQLVLDDLVYVTTSRKCMNENPSQTRTWNSRDHIYKLAQHKVDGDTTQFGATVLAPLDIWTPHLQILVSQRSTNHHFFLRAPTILPMGRVFVLPVIVS